MKPELILTARMDGKLLYLFYDITRNHYYTNVGIWPHSKARYDSVKHGVTHMRILLGKGIGYDCC